MSARLVDLYPIGDAVEIRFEDDPQRRWLPGVVSGHDYPGVWVATAGGRVWFVTNARRIRRAGPAPGQSSPTSS